jgi:hypothetical protein
MLNRLLFLCVLLLVLSTSAIAQQPTQLSTAPDGWTANASIGFEGGMACKEKNDLDAFHKLETDFQSEMKNLASPEKFKALFESSNLNKWTEAHKENGSCLWLGNWRDISIDEQTDHISCVRPEGQATCFWIDNRAIKLRLGTGFVFDSVACKDKNLLDSKDKAVGLVELERRTSSLPSGCRQPGKVVTFSPTGQSRISDYPINVTIEKLVGFNALIRVQGEGDSLWALKEWIQSKEEWWDLVIKTSENISVETFVLDGRKLVGAEVVLSGVYIREGNLDVLYADVRAATMAHQGLHQPNVPLLTDDAQRELRQYLLTCQSKASAQIGCPVTVLGRVTTCRLSNALGDSRQEPCVTVEDGRQ